jgi:hypothetical protein
MQAAIRFHREIAEACAKRDDEAARAVMTLHLIDAAERTWEGAQSDSVADENKREERGTRPPWETADDGDGLSGASARA